MEIKTTNINERQENISDAKRLKIDKNMVIDSNDTGTKMGQLSENSKMDTNSVNNVPNEMETEVTPMDSDEIISEEELIITLKVLQKLKDKEVDIKEKRFRPIRVLLPQLSNIMDYLPNKKEISKEQLKRTERARRMERRDQMRQHDQKKSQETALRKARAMALEALEGPQLCVLDGPCITEENIHADLNLKLERLRNCYSFNCHKKFDQLHHFYDQFCPECADFNWIKRHITADLEGRIAVVTGGRVKIGFHTVLKLLEAKCRVIVTTRFPHDASERFGKHPDFNKWKHLLEVYGIDLRNLNSLEDFCEHLNKNYSHLDILVNNACQTVRRPAAYYQPLVCREAILDKNSSEESSLVRSYEGMKSSADASQLQLCAEDTLHKVGGEVLPGQLDVNGHLVDLRARHSWVMQLHEIETPEIAEVFLINALAPFVLNRKLKPLLERSPFKRRFIINVSAMEGKFYRYKSKNHPHTNMAKAALNMMTRTSAQDYVESSIYMNSVDTGWINDEKPLEMARAHAEQDFQTPIDEVDAAARILNPVLEYTKETDPTPPFGLFLKDYTKTEW